MTTKKKKKKKKKKKLAIPTPRRGQHQYHYENIETRLNGPHGITLRVTCTNICDEDEATSPPIRFKSTT
ncbi:hypothetical protein M0802_002901 [Mischocyttarus mexicanus]|nr:hypothetical protein M0802_002901 [Mischocyttarus mexicanus]